MPEPAFPNKYTHRKVAETKARPCELSTCYRSTSSVLVTPENKDFFYVCPSHLKDRLFCSPVVDEAAAQAKNKEMDDELERVKKEYAEKQKAKKDKEEKDKENKEEKDKEKEDADKDKKDDKKDDKDTSKSDKGASEPLFPTPEPEPRVFTLHKTFFDMRLAKKQERDKAKRDQVRLAQPSFFPSVPKSSPGASGDS